MISLHYASVMNPSIHYYLQLESILLLLITTPITVIPQLQHSRRVIILLIPIPILLLLPLILVLFIQLVLFTYLVLLSLYLLLNHSHPVLLHSTTITATTITLVPLSLFVMLVCLIYPHWIILITIIMLITSINAVDYYPIATV